MKWMQLLLIIMLLVGCQALPEAEPTATDLPPSATPTQSVTPAASPTESPSPMPTFVLPPSETPRPTFTSDQMETFKLTIPLIEIRSAFEAEGYWFQTSYVDPYGNSFMVGGVPPGEEGSTIKAMLSLTGPDEGLIYAWMQIVVSDVLTVEEEQLAHAWMRKLIQFGLGESADGQAWLEARFPLREEDALWFSGNGVVVKYNSMPFFSEGGYVIDIIILSEALWEESED